MLKYANSSTKPKNGKNKIKKIMIPALDGRVAEWWNGLVGWSKVYEGMPNEPPPNESIVFAFSQISPPFVFVTQCTKNKIEAWQMIRNIIVNILPDRQIPEIDPFNPFLNYLYEIKDIIMIDTEQKIIKILENYINLRNPMFILWSFPESIFNLHIYYGALSTMIKQQIPFMKKYLFGVGYADQFFDRFLPLMDSKNTDIALSIIDLLCSLISEKIYSFTNLTDIVNNFLDQLWKAMESTDMSVSISAWRAVIFMLSLGKDCFNSTDYLQTINQLIKITSNISYLRYQTCIYLVKIDIPRFSYLSLVRQLLYIETTTIENFEIVDMLAISGVFKKYQPFMQILLTIAIQDTIWSKSAVSVLINVFSQHMCASDTQWVLNAIKNLFVYIGSIYGTKGNTEQCDIILVCMNMIVASKIDWVAKVIAKYYTTLVVTKTIKKLCPEIQMDKNVDYTLIRDIEIASQRPNLRTIISPILDFTVLPEQIERSKSSLSTASKSSRTPRPQIAKPPNKQLPKKSTGNVFKSTVKTALPRSRSFPLKQRL